MCWAHTASGCAQALPDSERQVVTYLAPDRVEQRVSFWLDTVAAEGVKDEADEDEAPMPQAVPEGTGGST